MASTSILPFPYPLSPGTDICHIPRIRRILEKDQKHVERFGQRMFSRAELPGFQERYDKVLQQRQTMSAHAPIQGTDDRSNIISDVQYSPYDRELLKLSNWMAGRFAAKEAAKKAMFPHRLAWHKAEVLTLPGRRKPVLVIHTSSPKADSHENEDRDHQQLRRQAAQHSISHDGDYATANVLAVNCFSVFSAIETLEDREEV